MKRLSIVDALYGRPATRGGRINESRLRQIVLQEARRMGYLSEDADSGQIDQKLFPTKLSQVDKNLAVALATKGQEDNKAEDDTSGTQVGASAPANTLKSSQTTMDFGKFVGMAIQMMGKIGNFSGGAGGDLGAIISSDNHIMDGHHRWAGTLMVDPSADVQGLRVNLPGVKLVGVLNVWTVSKGQSGKPSDTEMSALTPEAVGAKFKEMAQKGGGFLPSPEEILTKFKENGFDSLDAAVAHVTKNWAATAGLRASQDWMPAKVDMPAIEPSQLAKVAEDINSGIMDINPPYSPEVQSALGGSSAPAAAGGDSEVVKSGYERSGRIVAERWQKLAGIIK